jgi:hypothetical protein
MNDPERLQTLANQYLALKPMAPSQLMTLDQLAVNLPAPVAPSVTKPAVPPEAIAPAITDPTHGVPMASAAPAPGSADQAVALLQPQVAASPAPSDAAPAVDASQAQVQAQTQDGAVPADLAAITVLPPDVAPPPPPGPAPTPRLAVAMPAPAHRASRHVQTAAVSRTPVVTQSALAAPSAPRPAVDVQKARATHRTTQPAAGQLYAANEPVRQPYVAPRITPSAATVMYRPVSSSLGMAGSGTLAPPRPLYATTQ